MPASPNSEHIELGPCLGTGGHGSVYLATLHGFGGFSKRVAVKFLHEAFEKREGVLRRFRDEARMLGKLDHPHVIGIHGLYQFDRQWAVVMEYAPGVDLDHAMAHAGALPLRAAVQACADTAEALAYARDHVPFGEERAFGLEHRDVKPGNLLVDGFGMVKVLDFGVATAKFAGREAVTKQRNAMGTLPYLAPERWMGEPGRHADVYALATTLVQLVTHIKLPDSEAFSDMERWRQASLAALGALGPGAPIQLLMRACAQATSQDPFARPDVAAFHAQLLDIRHDLPGLELDRWALRVVRPLAQLKEASLVKGELTGRKLELRASRDRQATMSDMGEPPPDGAAGPRAPTPRPARPARGGGPPPFRPEAPPPPAHAVAATWGPDAPAPPPVPDGLIALEPTESAPRPHGPYGTMPPPDDAEPSTTPAGWPSLDVDTDEITARMRHVSQEPTLQDEVDDLVVPPARIGGFTVRQAALVVALVAASIVATLVVTRTGAPPPPPAAVAEPVPDGDKDGLPDAVDACPGEHAPGLGCLPVIANTVRMRWIPPGTFTQLGAGRRGDATRTVTFTHGFYLAETELPSALATGKGGSTPATRLTWIEALELANALSERDALQPVYAIDATSSGWTVVWNTAANGYRLPTEAEWAFAASDRGSSNWSGTNDASALCRFAVITDAQAGCRSRSASPVGATSPNALGVHDLSGNVAEWVWDAWGPLVADDDVIDPIGPTAATVTKRGGTDRVLRGGSYASDADAARAHARAHAHATSSSSTIGVRLVRSLPQPPTIEAD